MCVSGYCVRQSIEIVSTLENRHHPSVRVFVRHLHDERCQLTKIGVGEAKTSERIAKPRVKSGGDEDDIGTKFIHMRRQPVAKCAENLIAARARRERTIQRVTLRRAFPGLIRMSCARIPRRLVRAEK